MRSRYAAMLLVALASCSDGAPAPVAGVQRRPFTGITIVGVVYGTTGARTTAQVRLTLSAQDGTGGPVDCPTPALRDTTFATGADGTFSTTLLASDLVFKGCLRAIVTPASLAEGGSQTTIWPEVTLRDTALHDTLRLTVAIYPLRSRTPPEHAP